MNHEDLWGREGDSIHNALEQPTLIKRKVPHPARPSPPLASFALTKSLGKPLGLASRPSFSFRCLRLARAASICFWESVPSESAGFRPGADEDGAWLPAKARRG